MTDLTAWIGREQVDDDRIDLFPARGMLALLDREPDALAEGSVLPPLWHWLYFKPLVRRSDLGDDGHQRLGGFLPPVPLPRRMWAGGTLSFPGALRIGERARRRSVIQAVESKTGRTGRLVFVDLNHRIETERGPAVEETQRIVYREATTGSAAGGPEPPGPAAWSEAFSVDAVALFRFSALTFNGHRIHYDQAYATGVEGYPGLVVHGPLLALLLLDAAVRRSARAPERFSYRALSPLFATESFRLEGARRSVASPADGAVSELWVAGPRGLAMRATAEWHGGP